MNIRVPAQTSKEVPGDKNNCNRTSDDHARDVIKMKPRFAIFISLIFIIAACTAQGTPPVESIQSQETEQVEQDVRLCLGKLVFSTTIPRNIRVAEAPSHGKAAIIYDRKKEEKNFLKSILLTRQKQ